MRTTEYLYGVDPKQFQHMQYVDALNFRIVSAKALIVVLLQTPSHTRDHKHISDVIKAISFNEKLLEELL